MFASIAAAGSARATDIALSSHNPPALLLDQRSRFRKLLGTGKRVRHGLDGLGDDVYRDDVGALPREPHGMGATLASTGAGDERDLSVEPTHSVVPSDPSTNARCNRTPGGTNLLFGG
jgi:hypothetical protein